MRVTGVAEKTSYSSPLAAELLNLRTAPVLFRPVVRLAPELHIEGRGALNLDTRECGFKFVASRGLRAHGS